MTDTEFRQKLYHLFSRANEAYAVLSKELEDRQTPSPTPETASAPEAKLHSHSPTMRRPLHRRNWTRNKQKTFMCERRKLTPPVISGRPSSSARYAAAASPRDGRFHYLLGLALSENAYWKQEAEESLKSALGIDAQNPEYLYALADFYEKLGRLKEAKEMFDRAKSVKQVDGVPE